MGLFDKMRESAKVNEDLNRRIRERAAAAAASIVGPVDDFASKLLRDRLSRLIESAAASGGAVATMDDGVVHAPADLIERLVERCTEVFKVGMHEAIVAHLSVCNETEGALPSPARTPIEKQDLQS